MPAETKYILNRQLRMQEKSYDLDEANFNKQNKIFETMNEDLERLRESQDERDKKERRENAADWKNTLTAGLLGPLRLVLDPVSKAFNSGRDVYEQLKHKSDQEEEKFEVYETARKELNVLRKERQEEARINSIMGNNNPALEPSPANLMLSDAKFAKYFEKANKQEAKDKFFKDLKKHPLAALKTLAVPGQEKPAKMPSTALVPSAVAPEDAPIPLSTEIGTALVSSPAVENAAFEQDEDAPDVMDKIPADRSTLLAKGGVIGASAIFLAKELGGGLGSTKSKSKGEGGGLLDGAKGLGKGAFGFLKANGLSLLKVAAPLAALAAGGVMVAQGMKMQKRDSDDAKKHFDEGNTARGIETAILGDRSRLTEENANRELGRTAGKSALLAGGAGIAAAGGIGTAAMVGTVAAGGGLAAAGTAGVAALGAALPPALIGAAVITAGMVVAKGTQEAFELGWDKNQASIQKELNATMLSEDSSTMDKIKAGAESTWKGFTGALAGGIREAGAVLDAETQIQNEKQLNYIKEQAEAGSESHQRLFDMMQSEQFKAMSDAEQKAAMQAEGLYDEFTGSKKATQKSLGEHLLTAGRTVGGFFSGMADTTMEAQRGKKTAVWEKAALKGMESMTGEDADRLKQSKGYEETMANGGDHKKAMEAAYLAEAKEKAIARGDLREDGTVIQEGNWLGGMAAGAAAGGVPGAIAGALGGKIFGKYLGLGDTGMAYKEKQSDEEYRQTFEYSKRKVELMDEGMSAEEADLAAIKVENTNGKIESYSFDDPYRFTRDVLLPQAANEKVCPYVFFRDLENTLRFQSIDTLERDAPIEKLTFGEIEGENAYNTLNSFLPYNEGLDKTLTDFNVTGKTLKNDLTFEVANKTIAADAKDKIPVVIDTRIHHARYFHRQFNPKVEYGQLNNAFYADAMRAGFFVDKAFCTLPLHPNLTAGKVVEVAVSILDKENKHKLSETFSGNWLIEQSIHSWAGPLKQAQTQIILCRSSMKPRRDSIIIDQSFRD